MKTTVIFLLFPIFMAAQTDSVVVKVAVGQRSYKPIFTDNVDIYRAIGSSILAHTVDFPLAYCNTSSNLTDGQLRLSCISMPMSGNITGLKVYVRVQGNYTGDNNNRVGLYSYAASTGTLTLVASSDNSGTLWTSAANSVQNIPFSATYNAAPGIYYAAILYNNSAQTTAPALATGTALNNAAMAGTAYGFSNSAKLYGTVNTQTNLPSTIAMSSVTAATAPTWMALY